MLTQFLYGCVSRGIREDFFHESRRPPSRADRLSGEMLTQFLYGYMSRGIREDFFRVSRGLSPRDSLVAKNTPLP